MIVSSRCDSRPFDPYLAFPVSQQVAEKRKMLVASPRCFHMCRTHLSDPSWIFYHPKRPALNFHDDVG